MLQKEKKLQVIYDFLGYVFCFVFLVHLFPNRFPMAVSHF